MGQRGDSGCVRQRRMRWGGVMRRRDPLGSSGGDGCLWRRKDGKMRWGSVEDVVVTTRKRTDPRLVLKSSYLRRADVREEIAGADLSEGTGSLMEATKSRSA